MSNTPRVIKYSEALGEAHVQSMDKNPNAFILGVGVGDASGIFGSTKAPSQKFGPSRVIDTPMSENTLTGACVGAAIMGMRPVIVHARNDFLLLTMDQICNHAAKWRYMSGGVMSAPILVRAIIGRGWGQAAQHSQSLQSLFMHFPGLNVIMPSNAYDAKGLILAAMESDKTTVSLEHRWLYDKTGEVPEEYYMVPLGKAKVVREGKDVTVVAISEMVLQAQAAADELAKQGVEVEIIDPRSLRPLDFDTIAASVKKTGRLIVADTSWLMAGASAEIVARASESLFSDLKVAPIRLGMQDVPTPCSPVLEAIFYAGAKEIVAAAQSLMQKSGGTASSLDAHGAAKPFTGPF